MSDRGIAVPTGPGSVRQKDQAKRRYLSRGMGLLITAVSLYLIAPEVLEVFSSWEQLSELEPGWLVIVAGCQLASFASVWALQRQALRTRPWLPVITSQLAGNAASRVVPGGAAAGTAVQFHLLRTAGVETPKATSGLTAAGLLQLGITFTLPVVALPGVLLGAPAPKDLLNAARLGAILVAVLFAVVAAGLYYDWPLRFAGRVLDALLRHLPGQKAPEKPMSVGLLSERDALVEGLEGGWGKAAALAALRAAFDYLSLLAAMAALGIEAPPSLVLLAYASASLLSLVPLTPGGLGFVEAGLTGTLTLAGVPPTAALAVTLVYRLFSYWLPIPIGLLAGIFHRFRFS